MAIKRIHFCINWDEKQRILFLSGFVKFTAQYKTQYLVRHSKNVLPHMTCRQC